MKVKTSVSISKELVDELDREISDSGGRSAFIEAAVRVRLREFRREREFKREVERLNALVEGAEPSAVEDWADPFALGSPAAELVDLEPDGTR